MSLAAGKRLGPYEITSELGKGGMGEVYKARDTRLDRTVAIKILPEDLSASHERKARFEREAEAISQLNHPHICTLYDVGEEGRLDFLVMEYIEGETLAERLDRGPLPLDQALEYGVQLADGLDVAHGRGIVHRDLKPANVMLTKSGVKLLDFGLAKLFQRAPMPRESETPTRVRDVTKDHAFVGTLQYMAPEQLEGRPVDARTDIFVFGALLYEMVTGVLAFGGDTPADVVGAIMGQDPTATLQPLPTPALDRAVKKCLSKDPDGRWQSVRDLRDEIQWIAESGTKADVVTSRPEPTVPAMDAWIDYWCSSTCAGGVAFFL